MTTRHVLGLTLGAALAAAVAACGDLPSAPERPDATVESADSEAPVGDRGSGLFSSRAHILDPEATPLVSTAEQLDAGEYRFESSGPVADSVRRDDVIVAVVEGDPVPRRVLSVETDGGVLVLATGPARWDDVLNSGTYGATMPIGPGSATSTPSEALALAYVDGDTEIPPLEANFELDLCELTDSIVGDIRLCGVEQELSVTLGATVELDGTVDSLAIHDGRIQATGTMGLEMTVDAGGVRGGTPPVFTPCNRQAYLGCLTTPTGADLIDWLRRYAPQIPEASLRPVRVCIPGTPVRVAPGYWEGWTWNPARYEQCRVADQGELPEVVPPSLQGAQGVIQPRIRGSMTPYAKGSGKLSLRVPIPKLGWAAGFILSNQGRIQIEGRGSVGLFVDLSLEAPNAAASVPLTFDEEIRVLQTWTPEAGWSSEIEPLRSNQAVGLTPEENPDSIIVRGGPVVGATLDLGIAGGAVVNLLGLGANVGLEFSPLAEGVIKREQVHPTDPEIDNLRGVQDALYELRPTAGIDLPGDFLLPNGPLTYDSIFEFGRVRAIDQWGLSHTGLLVEVRTEGTELDADGYTAVVDRYDTLPRIVAEGAERTNAAYDLGRPLEKAVGTNGLTLFTPETPGTCAVAYSDAALNQAPFLTLPVGVALVVARERDWGFAVPNYAVVVPPPACDLLVARHVVTLTDVAPNCSVEGGLARNDVWPLVPRGGADARVDTARVTFDVTCGEAAAMGTISVTADVPTPVDGDFDVRVDEGLVGLIEAAETRDFDEIGVGTRTVTLTGLPSYCSATSETVEVLEAATAAVTIGADCDIPVSELDGTVTASVLDGGGVPPDDAFGLTLDGVLKGGVASGDETIVDGIEPSTPAALLLTRIEDRCRVTNENPVVVDPDEAASALFVEFMTECTDAPIDTVDGGITTSGFPVEAAFVEDAATEESLRLTGPVAEELVQLAGANVRVWGVRAGTSLEVYGYEIGSSLGEPRWIGVLLERDGALWLMGESAIELVDSPPDLSSRVGAVVWVGGDEIEVGSVVPRVYGVIRGAGS